MIGKPYTGVLADPDDADAPEEWGWVQMAERLVALKEHYGVEDLSEGGLFDLVLCLACDHVPGFKSPSRSGRPPERAVHDAIIVYELYHAKNKTEAARQLISKYPGFQTKEPESIRTRYYAVMSRSREGRDLWLRARQVLDDAVFAKTPRKKL